MNPNSLLLSEPAPAKPVPTLPLDPGLPQLHDILDGRVMRLALRGAGINVEEARPRYMRYKPGNKAIVLYEASLSGRWTTAVVTASARRDLAKLRDAPYVRELADRVRGRTQTGTPLMFLDRLRALVEWFPLNRLIPGLALSPAALTQRIAGSPEGTAQAREPVPLTYKPERRAVTRFGHVIVKAYARTGDFDQAVSGFQAGLGAPSLAVPALVDAIPEHRVTLQSVVPGTRPRHDHADDLGRALAMLHAAPVHSPFRTSAHDHLAAAGKTCRHVGFVLPPVRRDAEELIGRLQSQIPVPCPLVQSHGDFHADQALVENHQVTLIDFDHACASHPALDLATFAAHLVDGTEGAADAALSALTGLLRGYGEPPRDLKWFLAAAILRRTSLPFRVLAPDWPTRVRNLLQAAADVLSGHQRIGGP